MGKITSRVSGAWDRARRRMWILLGITGAVVAPFIPAKVESLVASFPAVGLYAVVFGVSYLVLGVVASRQGPSADRQAIALGGFMALSAVLSLSTRAPTLSVSLREGAGWGILLIPFLITLACCVVVVGTCALLWATELPASRDPTHPHDG